MSPTLIPLAAALIGAVSALLVASLSAWLALRKSRADQAFERKRAWYEKAAEIIAEQSHYVGLYEAYGMPGSQHPKAVEIRNRMIATSRPVFRLTFTARLYAEPNTIAALDALHRDAAVILTQLDYYRGEEKREAILHLGRRIAYTMDELTAAYRQELRFPALQPLLSDERRTAMLAWTPTPRSPGLF